MNSPAVRANYRVTFAVLAVGVAAFALLQSLVIPVLPTIQVALGTDQTDVTWVLTGYLLSASIFTPIIGRLGDMYGKKRFFVVALTALAIGSFLAAIATVLPVMVLARVIQGVGGGVLPLTFGIIRDEFPKEKVPGAVGLVAALTAVGAGFGTLIAGPIVDTLSYHWLFWIPLIMTAIAGVSAHFLIPESIVRTAGKVNFVNAFLLSGWLVALLLAVSQAPKLGWSSPLVVGLLIAAACVLVVWVIAESRSSNPLIDMRMMRLRAVWTANLVALLMGFGLFAALGFMPQFLQTPSSAGYGFGASITESGLMMIPNTIAMFVFGLCAGRLAARFGSKNLLIAGSVLSSAGYFVVAFAHSTKVDIYLAMTLTGVGLGLAFSAMANVVVAAVPPEQTGVASGMNANVRTIGGSLGAALMATVVTAGAPPGTFADESGYTNGFTMLGCVVALAAVASLFIPKVGRSKRTGREPSVELAHAELAPIAGATLVGDEPE